MDIYSLTVPEIKFSNGSVGLCFFQRLQGRLGFPALSLPESPCILWLMTLFLYLQSQHQNVFKSPSSVLDPSPPSFKDFCEVTFASFRDQGMDVFGSPCVGNHIFLQIFKILAEPADGIHYHQSPAQQQMVVAQQAAGRVYTEYG